MGHVSKTEPRSRTSSPAELAAEERELVRRAQAGDVAAYEELVQRHQRRVFAIVSGMLRRNEDVEDVAQQVFIKVYLSLKRFDLRSAFGTWLYKIAVNECRDYLRKKRARRLVYEADLSEEQVWQLDAVEPGQSRPITPERRVELQQLLNRLLEELSAEERAMLVLKEVEGYSVEEIGNLLDVNVNTVKVKLFRARGRLMEFYRRRLRAAGSRRKKGSPDHGVQRI
jgi:RNA polymerase sigma-70 factor (ECF subfamily)